MSSNTTVVWLKRDLRTLDHAPLHHAVTSGECVCLYIYEPEIINADDFSAGHLSFINRSLLELDEELSKLGGKLITRKGGAVEVLDQLHEVLRFDELVSHEETGNAKTYARDKQVKKWAKEKQVVWTEFSQFGVVRGLKNRDGWSKRWNYMMAQPIIPAPKIIVSRNELHSDGILGQESFGLTDAPPPLMQAAGQTAAQEMLNSFLSHRAERYQSEMSSPRTGVESCSRLSPHFAYGNISMRQVYQALQTRRMQLRAAKRRNTEIGSDWLKSLASFDKRLHWHCHFIQKLESDPRIEWENMATAYNGLREPHFDQKRFEAWCEGKTGYPMVDACMRFLKATGWLNFRMRAMVVSFASYHLWLHWRPTGLYLAKQFVDYEPGIHFSQMQMQSGTTGINAVRIYSPTKQVTDQDPQGEFIRRWVPELADVPNQHIAQPSRMSRDEQSQFSCVIGVDYPKPLVDHAQATALARKRIYGRRREKSSRAEANEILQKHGSRRRASRGKRKPKKAFTA